MLEISWLFDFHSHKVVRIGQRPEPQDVARGLAEAGVSEVTFHAKCHIGFSYYPTQVGAPHPQLEGDVFGQLVKHAKAAGLTVFAYVSFGIDGEAGRQHPDWLKHMADGPHCWDDWFAYICPFTGYTDELLLPQVEEIARLYPAVDGFWFDTMSAWAPCYCASCERDFEREFRRRIPRETSDPLWAAFGEFRHRRATAMLQRVGSHVQRLHPGAIVGFNQVGSTPFPERPPQEITRLTLDYPTKGHQSRQASMCAAFATSTGLDADVIPTIFNGGWGDWAPAPPQRLEQLAATVWARRCRLNVGDRLHPDARLTPISRQILDQLSHLRRGWLDVFPPERSELAPDVVVLHDQTSHYGADKRHFSVEAKDRLRPLQGMCDLLLDAGVNYTVCPDYALEAMLPKARVLVLPQSEALSRQTSELIQRFADRGGQVLIVGSELPRVDGHPIRWAGIEQEKKPWHDHVYLPPAGPDGLPVLVRGAFRRSRVKDAEPVMNVIPPLDVSHGIRFGWGIAPPSESEAADAPVLTCRSVGTRDGAIWCLTVALASDYNDQGHWQQVKLAEEIMRRVLPRPGISVRSPYGQIEVVGHADESAQWAVLVNHSAEHVSDGGWARTWGGVVPIRVEVTLRDPAKRSPRRVMVDGQVVTNYTADDGAVRITVDVDRICRVVEVGWTATPANVRRNKTTKTT